MLSAMLCLGSTVQLSLTTTEGFLFADSSPGVTVSGLEPGQIVRVSAQRTFSKVEFRNGAWGPVPVPMISWADFRADGKGRIDADRQRPMAGTWRRAESIGFHYSLVPFKQARVDPPLLPDEAASNLIKFSVQSGSELIAQAEAVIRDYDSSVVVEDVTTPVVIGAYARPKVGKDFPLVIYLHGSEGSSVDGARSNAARFAMAGFACFALSYSARPWMNYTGVPTDAVNVPLEVLDRVRAWARGRSELDINRIALYGVSKGAEMATVAGTKLTWPKAIVACVGSDSVWEGYGRTKNAGEFFSSWSWRGKPLDYIPYLNSDEFFAQNPGIQAREWHRQSRGVAGEETERRARIPVEDLQAPILLLAGERDEVWPSGEMARSVARQMTRAGKGSLVTLRVFPQANHQISGAGGWPQALYAPDPLGPNDADPLAVAEATVDAWRITREFLARELRR